MQPSLDPPHPPPAPGGLRAWQLQRVESYARAHMDDDIRLEHLAAVAGLSRFHFCTTFRRSTGRTPRQWLVALRMSRARELLAGTRLPMTQIALEVGYQTPSAFASAFRRAAGATPSEFRRALQVARLSWATVHSPSRS